jgi:hypothetical protein
VYYSWVSDPPDENELANTIDPFGGPQLTDEEEFEQMFGVDPEAYFDAVICATDSLSESEQVYWANRFDPDDLDALAVGVAKAHPESARDIANAIYGLGRYLPDEGWPDEDAAGPSPGDDEVPTTED